jgi:hypothetical protein
LVIAGIGKTTPGIAGVESDKCFGILVEGRGEGY